MKCRNCGTPLASGAMFCGECGSTVTVPKLVEPPVRARGSDTAVIQPIRRLPDEQQTQPVFRPSSTSAVRPVRRATPITTPVPPARGSVPAAEAAADASAPVSVPEAPVEQPPVFERIALPEPWPEAPVAPVPVASMPVASMPVAQAQAPATAHDTTDIDDLEATRIVRSSPVGDKFVLQFSTGDSATVFGTGLLGRNPLAEPGEFFDQLVVIVDPGKSVSKTHLEFGQTAGEFWVSDRYSGNGTVVRPPDAAPRRVQPGKRQTVARGARVDIGEQFFVVS